MEFAITGKIDNIRPIIGLVIAKRGYTVVEKPATGTRGLIIGVSHNDSHHITAH